MRGIGHQARRDSVVGPKGRKSASKSANSYKVGPYDRFTSGIINQRKFRLRNFRYTNDISVKLSQVE